MTHTAEPKVTLVAHTALADGEGGTAAGAWMPFDPDATAAENLIEFAGRACYQSFHKPNPATAKNGDYLSRTLHGQGHYSIAEHASATVYIEGVSRALTHELVRHRHLSFSQLSQRFVNEEDSRIVIPPAIRDSHTGSKAQWGLRGSGEELERGTVVDMLEESSSQATQLYGEVVNLLQSAGGFTRKQAREAARAVLPNMTETKIVVTGNMRTWYEVIDRRIQSDADAEIQEVSREILKIMLGIAPSIFEPLRKHLED